MAYNDLRQENSVADNGLLAAETTILVSRRESFNAAHQLADPRLSDEENERLFGKCANLHGHNYVLEVVVGGRIDTTTGYVMDLKHLADIIERRIIRDVDHRNLNTDVPWLEGLHPDRGEPGARVLGTDPPRVARGIAAIGARLGDGQELGGGRWLGLSGLSRRRASNCALASRYTAADLEVFTEAERRRFLYGGEDPRSDVELAWELLYRPRAAALRPARQRGAAPPRPGGVAARRRRADR